MATRPNQEEEGYGEVLYDSDQDGRSDEENKGAIEKANMSEAGSKKKEKYLNRIMRNKGDHRKNTTMTYVFSNSRTFDNMGNPRAQLRMIDLVYASAGRRNPTGRHNPAVKLNYFEGINCPSKEEGPCCKTVILKSMKGTVSSTIAGYPLVINFPDFKRKSDDTLSGVSGKSFFYLEQEKVFEFEWAPNEDSVNHDELSEFIATSGDYIGGDLRKGIITAGTCSLVPATRHPEGLGFINYHPVLILLEEDNAVEVIEFEGAIFKELSKTHIPVDSKKCQEALHKLDGFWEDVVMFDGRNVRVNLSLYMTKAEANSIITTFEEISKEYNNKEEGMKPDVLAFWKRFNTPRIIDMSVNFLTYAAAKNEKKEEEEEDSGSNSDPQSESKKPKSNKPRFEEVPSTGKFTKKVKNAFKGKKHKNHHKYHNDKKYGRTEAPWVYDDSNDTTDYHRSY
jgi:hypothetical protein